MESLIGVKRCTMVESISSRDIREDLSETIKEHKRKWKEYIERMSDIRLSKQAIKQKEVEVEV